jgi:hypothetical protein
MDAVDRERMQVFAFDLYELRDALPVIRGKNVLHRFTLLAIISEGSTLGPRDG